MMLLIFKVELMKYGVNKHHVTKLTQTYDKCRYLLLGRNNLLFTLMFNSNIVYKPNHNPVIKLSHKEAICN